VQELAVVIAPKLLGGTLARTPLGDLGFTEMDQVMALSDLHAQRLGRDLLLEQRLI
jgi:diaminohydroxyphosphoribosylaminopyrimidine deaminase/5-amino-6-(5-phosphoribosylamino)uracil reductase